MILCKQLGKGEEEGGIRLFFINSSAVYRRFTHRFSTNVYYPLIVASISDSVAFP